MPNTLKQRRRNRYRAGSFVIHANTAAWLMTALSCLGYIKT
jgi:hypothetical protein